MASDLGVFSTRNWKSVDGIPLSWDSQVRLHVFCMVGTECPVSRMYASRLQTLCEEFQEKGVRFLGVASNLQDSGADLKRFIADLGIAYPVILDRDQSLARDLKATRTAEVIVVDSEDKIIYRGRVDDQYAPGAKRAVATQHELRNAIREHLGGRSVALNRTDPVGCLITFRKAENSNLAQSTLYADTIAPIFFRHCVECHRPGEIGPFDMTQPDELAGWGEMIVEVIEQKRMPPWHAKRGHVAFKNERFLSDEEIQKIKNWVQAGSPIGDTSQLPQVPSKVDGWRLSKRPDLIVEMASKPYTVPSVGSVDYQYFVVDPGLQEDRWVSAAQVVPGDPSVVHHAIVFIRPPDDAEFTGIGWLTAYVPGQRATEFPVGFARKIPAGSKFVFQMHYTPNGKATRDLTKIGVNFLDASEVTHEVFTILGIDQEFEIPPNAPSHQVHARANRLPTNGLLLAIMPHMHLRGKAFELRQHRADEVSVLLDIPRYDFDWQHTYELAKPIDLNQVDSLEFTATFDNSKDNPFNPAPNEYVMWGDQTWEEMAVAFFEVARPRESAMQSRPVASTSGQTAKQETGSSDEHIQFAERFLSQFDSNKDAQISFHEVPRIIQDYSFYRMDTNRDGTLTRLELLEAAKARRAK